MFMPYIDPAVFGNPAFPATNLPFVVQAKDGRSLTFGKSAIRKPAEMTLCPNTHMWGEAEFGLLLPEQYAIGDAGSCAVDAASAYTEPNISNSDEYFGAFSMQFGTGPLAIIPDKVGIRIINEVTLDWIKPGMEPTRQAVIMKVGLTIEVVPITCTTTQFYSTLAILAGSGAGLIGGPVVGGVITIADLRGSGSGGLQLVIPNAARVTGGVRYAQDGSRVNTIKFSSQQQYGATASQTIIDGVTNTDTSLVSATAAFVAGDVGKTVTGAGIPTGTTISTRTNATTVVLSQATTATATGVTFTIVNRTLTGWQPLMLPSLL
jgi:hypothetical protein